jgi:hypothetical protein
LITSGLVEEKRKYKMGKKKKYISISADPYTGIDFWFFETKGSKSSLTRTYQSEEGGTVIRRGD